MTNYDDTEEMKKYDNKLNVRLKEIKPQTNQKHILSYDNRLKLDRRSLPTTISNKERLINLFKNYIKKEWGNITKEDMEKIVAEINNSKLSEKTKSNYKKMFKQFDKWFNGGKTPSERTDWINTTPSKRKLNTLQRSDLLTEEEKRKLIKATDNKRDAALISIWLETGLRPKELRVLTIGSITIEKDLAYINVPNDTKTGTRLVPIYFSKPVLVDYLNEHPARDNDKAPLWVKLKRNSSQGYQAIVENLNKYGYDEILGRIATRAGIKKRVYWYLGRHNSYTDKVSQGWNEGILKQFHGIEAGSTVLNRYVHLSGKDVTSKVKEYYGLEKSRVNAPELTLIKCVNCGKENPNTNKRCSKCGYIIDTRLMAEEIEKKSKSEQKMKGELTELKSELSKMKQTMQEMAQAIITQQKPNIQDIEQAIKLKKLNVRKN